MGRILSKERAIEYSVEFKIKIVELTNQLDVDASQIAGILNLHPVMFYRCDKNIEKKIYLSSYP